MITSGVGARMSSFDSLPERNSVNERLHDIGQASGSRVMTPGELG